MAYSKRDYLNLREKMNLYILLQAQDAIQNYILLESPSDAIQNIAKWRRTRSRTSRNGRGSTERRDDT